MLNKWERVAFISMAILKGRENTKEEIKRGEEFGLWMRVGIAHKNWKIAKLAEETKLSASYLGRLANDNGVPNSTGAYVRPGEDVISIIAEKLELDVVEGRRKAGYTENPDAPEPPKLLKYNLGVIAGAQTEYASSKELTEEEIDRVRRAIQLALGD